MYRVDPMSICYHYNFLYNIPVKILYYYYYYYYYQNLSNNIDDTIHAYIRPKSVNYFHRIKMYAVICERNVIIVLAVPGAGCSIAPMSQFVR